MAIPVLDPTTSVLGFRMFERVNFQPAASNAPTGWTCAGLPPGLAIDAATGLILGAATDTGVFVCPLVATNATGPSLALNLTFGIEPAGFANETAIEMDIDLPSGAVSFPTVEAVSQPGAGTGAGGDKAGPAVLLRAKKGDDLPLLVGLKKNGVLLDLPVAALGLAIKQFDPDAPLIVTTGEFTKVGAYESTRWRMLATLAPAALEGAISENDADTGSAFVALCEVQVKIQQTDPHLPGALIRRTSQTFGIEIARDEVPD